MLKETIYKWENIMFVYFFFLNMEKFVFSRFISFDQTLVSFWRICCDNMKIKNNLSIEVS